MPEWLDWILHIDDELLKFVEGHGTYVYGLLFAIIFCETGLVFMPLLPGDSLLFAAGALAAKPELELSVGWMWLLMVIAAILGDTVNYHLGYFFGAKMPLINPKHIARTQAFYERHGGKTIILARFVPIVRTFAPFVAGVGAMSYGRFLTYNVVGAVLWVALLVLAGFFFGNIPVVRENFTIVILAIIAISVMPIAVETIRGRRRPA
jgi:membrane-associated protein